MHELLLLLTPTVQFLVRVGNQVWRLNCRFKAESGGVRMEAQTPTNLHSRTMG